jgi:hypothetical protein
VSAFSLARSQVKVFTSAAGWLPILVHFMLAAEIAFASACFFSDTSFYLLQTQTDRMLAALAPAHLSSWLLLLV